jgi:hypothetical protein
MYLFIFNLRKKEFFRIIFNLFSFFFLNFAALRNPLFCKFNFLFISLFTLLGKSEFSQYTIYFFSPQSSYFNVIFAIFEFEFRAQFRPDRIKIDSFLVYRNYLMKNKSFLWDK